MSLAPGARLGPYEILAAIGAGGMGEVYRARDPRLGRDVAVKIVSAAFSSDPDRHARFEREARLISQLNHPNICALYHISDHEGIQFLVLELVEGPTLADRIAQGPLPVEEAVAIARQICDALEAAHDIGIIHRDLKPANIKLTPDGTVKVLDFGLAKALGPAEAGHYVPDGSVRLQADLSVSPTLTSPAMTRMGVILGTAVYMSPEQAKGRPADKRSDVWGFGCVLFEMLTAKRAFEGEDLTDTIAAVVRGEPDWSALPGDLPPQVRALLVGCLQKDRKARIGDIAVARFLLEQGLAVPGARGVPVADARPARSTWLTWGSAAVAVASLLAALMMWLRSEPAPVVSTPVRLTADIGADASMDGTVGAAAILSPDGTVLAFAAEKTSGEGAALYVRRLDQLGATPLNGTEGAQSPFFSPDGKWIGFFAQGKLRKVAVTGGAAITLCDAPAGRGGSWSEDGSIIFTPYGQAGTGLHRVSAEGGASEKVSELANGEASQRWPQVLPGGKAVIFTSPPVLGDYANSAIVLQPLPTGPRKILVKGGAYARYVPSGHLVYVLASSLFAAPFDLERLEVTGPAVPVLEGVRAGFQSGGAQFDLSGNGTLVYVPGQAAVDTAPIQWLDRTGRLSSLRSAAASWSNPSFSPDGRVLAMDIHDGKQSDVWTFDVERNTLSRLTFDPADDLRPVWTPDGQRIAFASTRGAPSIFNLYWQRADGTGEAQRLTNSKASQHPSSFHPNGRTLALMENVPNNASDVIMLPIEGGEQGGWKTGAPSPFLQGPFIESSAMFSPDGRWVAYLSNESGRNDIYVQPFPGPGGKYQVSVAAADDPTWSRTAPEFFYLNTSDLRMMVVPYRTAGDAFRADTPAVLNETRISVRPRAPSRDLDLHPDGKRFVVAGGEEAAARKVDKVVFVFNFDDELRRVAPVKARD